MNTCTRIGTILLAALLLLLWGCGGSAQPTPKEGVVYLDPNAPAAPQAQSTDAPAPQAEAAPAVAAATGLIYYFCKTKKVKEANAKA